MLRAVRITDGMACQGEANIFFFDQAELYYEF